MAVTEEEAQVIARKSVNWLFSGWVDEFQDGSDSTPYICTDLKLNLREQLGFSFYIPKKVVESADQDCFIGAMQTVLNYHAVVDRVIGFEYKHADDVIADYQRLFICHDTANYRPHQLSQIRNISFIRVIGLAAIAEVHSTSLDYDETKNLFINKVQTLIHVIGEYSETDQSYNDYLNELGDEFFEKVSDLEFLKTRQIIYTDKNRQYGTISI
jgi:hypothetical protein